MFTGIVHVLFTFTFLLKYVTLLTLHITVLQMTENVLAFAVLRQYRGAVVF